MRVLSVVIGAVLLACTVHEVNSQAAEAYGQSLLDYYTYYQEGSCNLFVGTGRPRRVASCHLKFSILAPAVALPPLDCFLTS